MSQNAFEVRQAFEGNQISGIPYLALDQGLCVGNGYILHSVNQALRIYEDSANSTALTAVTALVCTRKRVKLLFIIFSCPSSDILILILFLIFTFKQREFTRMNSMAFLQPSIGPLILLSLVLPRLTLNVIMIPQVTVGFIWLLI